MKWRLAENWSCPEVFILISQKYYCQKFVSCFCCIPRINTSRSHVSVCFNSEIRTRRKCLTSNIAVSSADRQTCGFAILFYLFFSFFPLDSRNKWDVTYFIGRAPWLCNKFNDRSKRYCPIFWDFIYQQNCSKIRSKRGFELQYRVAGSWQLIEIFRRILAI